MVGKAETISSDGAQTAANLETLREEVIKRTDYLNNKRAENEKIHEDSMNSIRSDTLQSLLELRQHMNAEVSKEFKTMEEKIRNDQAAFGEQVKKLLQDAANASSGNFSSFGSGNNFGESRNWQSNASTKPIMEHKVMQGLKMFTGERGEFKQWNEKLKNALGQVLGKGVKRVMEFLAHCEHTNKDDCRSDVEQAMEDASVSKSEVAEVQWSRLPDILYEALIDRTEK